MDKEVKNNKIIFIIITILFISLTYVCWHTFKKRPPQSNEYIEQYIDGNMYRSYEDGTVIKMS